MATAPATLTDQRVVLYDISWAQYEALLEWVGERPSIRLTYDRGRLEIMTLSSPHERFKKCLAQAVEILTDEFDLPSECLGSMTIRRQDLERGLELDECYYLDPDHAEAVRGKEEIDFTIDPPPDLIVEVDISASSDVRIGIYATLGVPEVWRFDGASTEFLGLGADGRYSDRMESRYFPGVNSIAINRFLLAAVSTDKTAWRKAFRAWVRKNLRPGAGA